MWVRSAKYPCKRGMIAPPTIAIIRREEPFEVSSPKSLTDKLKIVGNIIELNNPMLMIDHIAMEEVAKTPISKAIIPANEKILRVRAGKFFPIKNPIKFTKWSFFS